MHPDLATAPAQATTDLEDPTSVLGIKALIDLVSKDRARRIKLAHTMPTVRAKRMQESITTTFAAFEDMLTDMLPGRPS
jgi:hypothetical protein